MLCYYPVPSFAEGLCGLAYALSSGDEAVTLRLPALTAQIQVTLSGSVRHASPASDLADPDLALLGPTSTAALAHLAPRTLLLGVGLLPAGWLRAVPIPASDVANKIVAGEQVWGVGAAVALLEEVRSTSSAGTSAKALFRFATRPQAGESAGDPRIAGTMVWLSRAGTMSVTDLARALDLSLRQTERFTARVFGETPKLLEMKYRVLRLAAVSAISETRVYDVERDGLVDSFYDQSHLIRNFHRFVGHAPHAFDLHAPFAREMLQGRWQHGARSPMMLWS